MTAQGQRWLDKLGILTCLGLAVAVTLGVKQIVAKVRRRK